LVARGFCGANVCLAESHWYRSVFIVPGGVFGAMVSDSKQ
jgi:hypothetical protein